MKKLFLILSLILCFEIVSDIAPNETHAAFDSLLEYETRTTYDGLADFLIKVLSDIYTCFWTNIILDFGQVNQTCIPRLITSDAGYEKDCSASKNNSSFLSLQILGTAVFIISLIGVIALSAIPIIGEIAWVVVGMAFINVIVTCLGAYVLAPHEYINYLKGTLSCYTEDGVVKNGNPNAVTQAEVPFFYTCLDHENPRDLAAADPRLDVEYGNMTGPSTPYCQGGNERYAVNDPSIANTSIGGVQTSKLVGGIIVKNVSFWKMIGFSSRGLCNLDADDSIVFTRDDVMNGRAKGTWIDNTIAFFRIYSGRIQLCSATATLAAPIINGCSYVAPPIEMIKISAGYADNTRCTYFLSSRGDLNSLGNALNKDAAASVDANGNASIPFSSVGLFLQSDLHIMSTVVGCIQDLLTKIVVGSDNSHDQSFLWTIQSAGFMQQIVKVVLVLYVSLLGIKVISSPQPPQMGEVVMYVLKFAFVIVMSGLGGQKIWYNTNENHNTGLYPLILETMNDLSNRVLQSTNKVSPVNMCYLVYDQTDKNLLSEINLPIQNYQNVQPTISLDNSKFVKLTVWDYIDCKIAGYLNLNSCKYTMSGMVSFWLASVCIFFPSTFLIGIMTIIFSIVLFLTMTRFVHLAIVSMFALTILVLVSPLMVCFILFEYTKQTFQSWFKMMLGYILYPAIIFSFVALMISTFDAIFYGQPYNPECLDKSNCSVVDICGLKKDDKGVSIQNDSMYCNIVSAVYKNTDPSKIPDPTMCTVKSGTILNSLTSNYNIKLFGITIMTTRTLSDESFDGIFRTMMQMMLFAILFYQLTNAIISFLETLLGVYGISGMVPSHAGPLKQGLGYAFSAGKFAATAPFKIPFKARDLGKKMGFGKRE
jgi:type IV secretion system protein VirB6